jgi:hypothetical protein
VLDEILFERDNKLISRAKCRIATVKLLTRDEGATDRSQYRQGGAIGK